MNHSIAKLIKARIDEINALKDLLADTLDSNVVKYEHPGYEKRLKELTDDLYEAKVMLKLYFEVN